MFAGCVFDKLITALKWIWPLLKLESLYIKILLMVCSVTPNDAVAEPDDDDDDDDYNNNNMQQQHQ